MAVCQRPYSLGHLAGVYVPADIYVRYLRLKKEDLIMIGGSDEHGVPITLKAKNEGITPQDVVDKFHKIIKESFQKFGISFDVYSRGSAKVPSRSKMMCVNCGIFFCLQRYSKEGRNRQGKNKK